MFEEKAKARGNKEMTKINEGKMFLYLSIARTQHGLPSCLCDGFLLLR